MAREAIEEDESGQTLTLGDLLKPNAHIASS
jgi:hypothetical protein